MANAVFTTRLSPSYDDVPEERYHFPRTYLRQVSDAIGDWIVYYEPRRTGDAAFARGRQSYFALARVREVVPDARRDDHFYALIDDYAEFVNPVPFKAGKYWESILERDDGETNKGAFGRAVRFLPRREFDAIVEKGMNFVPLPYETDLVPRMPPALDSPAMSGFADEQAPFHYERPLVEQTLTRPLRDATFRRLVRNAYENRCAITGLQLLNGGGRPEVQAAHIVAVEDHGPDSVRNGLALSGTFHWMFDRGLISVDDDYRIQTAAKHIPDQLLPLFPKSGHITLPREPRDWPHQAFLRHHRETRFKG